MHIQLIPCFCLVVISSFAQGKKLTLEAIWKSKTFSVNLKEDLIWASNGHTYTQKQLNIESNLFDIYKFDVSSGKLVDTLLKGEWLVKSDPNTSWLFTGYAVSPKEDFILIALNEEPIYRNSTQAEYFLVELKTRKTTRLCGCFKASLAEFSPDGKYVSFIRENNLFLKKLADMSEIQVSMDGLQNHVLNGMPDWVYEEEFSFHKAYYWSEDGKHLAYLSFNEVNVPIYSLQTWKSGSSYPVSEKYRYPKAGERNPDVQVRLFNLNNQEHITLPVQADNKSYIPRVSFADNNHLVIQKLNRAQNEWTVVRYNIPKGEIDTLILERSNTYIEITNDLYFSSNGQKLIYTSDKGGYRHIYLMEIGTKKTKMLTDGEWEVEKVEGFDPIKGWVYFTSNKEGAAFRNLKRVNIHTFDIQNLTDENGYYSLKLSNDGKFFFRTFSTLQTPPVITVHLHDGRLVRYVEKNQVVSERLKEYNLSVPEFFQIETDDNVKLEAYMIKPKNFDKNKKYPVLFYVYGGPNHQTVINKWQHNNYLWHQFLAQNEYIVVSVDPRGSGGKGKEFSHYTYGKLGKYETRDVVEAARYMAKQPYVDSKKVGIWGWSYGGYLSTLALAFGSDVFSYAIAIAPVTSWRLYDSIYTERYLKTPSENPLGYDEYSPINHAEQLKGRYLLVHGTGDDNVHVQHSYLMQDALVNANKQFDFFVYTDKNHGISGGNTRLHLFTMMYDFIKRKQ